AAPDVGSDTVDIRCYYIRFHTISIYFLRCISMINRVNEVEQFSGALILSQLRKRPNRPQCCMGVLSSVLTDTSWISFDIARITGGALEGRREQLDQFIIHPDQLPIN